MSLKQSRDIMGMPITVEIIGPVATLDILEKVFAYFTYVDEKFSTYKTTSEISKLNRGELDEVNISADMKTVLNLSELTKQATGGYFNITKPDQSRDPSGLVKGWAIYNASLLLKQAGGENFYIEAGGDIEAQGYNKENQFWKIGIRNPFKPRESEIVKVVYLHNQGIATSGTYLRGQHIYNPKTNSAPLLTL